MKEGEFSLPGSLQYDPERLIQELKRHLAVGNDSALARALDVAPPLLSKIRHRRQPVTGAVLLRMHEVSGLSIQQLRLMLGDRRSRFRMSGERQR